MAASLNRAQIIGNVGKDPEIRSLQSGDKIANLSVATSESWTDKASGEKKEKTQWHNVVIFNKHLVDIVEKYVQKGSRIFVEGQIETRKWTDNNGADKYTTEIVLRFEGKILLLSGGGDKPKAAPAAEKTRSAPVDALEDEIPF